MVFVMFLLGLVYVLFVGVLIAIHLSPILIGVIAGGFFLFQFFGSDRIALYAMHGKIVTPEEAPELHAIIDRLCAMSNTPKPKVAIADSDVPNAFATGRSQKRAVVCATTGIMRRLDNEELEGVLAHEMSHVAHHDVVVMTIASFLGVLAGLVTRFAFYATMFGGGGNNRGRNNNQDSAAVVELVVLLASAIVYAISFLLIRALSRYRELSADRSGALLTGRPSALASALAEGHRCDGSDSDPRPAFGRELQRLLLHPGACSWLLVVVAVLDSPAARQAARTAGRDLPRAGSGQVNGLPRHRAWPHQAGEG